MKRFLKYLSVVVLVVVLLVPVGLWRLHTLNNADSFNTFNKAEVYVGGLLMGIVAYPLYPEVAREHLMLYMPSKTTTPEPFKTYWEDDFFLASDVVQQAIAKARQSGGITRLEWPSSAYTTSEARYALALNGGYVVVSSVSPTAELISVHVPIVYPEKAFAPLLKIGSYTIGIEEGLFRMLQDEGWLGNGVVVWTHVQEVK